MSIDGYDAARPPTNEITNETTIETTNETVGN
jgi:hypothetical protein